MAQISGHLKSSFEDELPTLVRSIVEGVVSTLSQNITLLSNENAKQRQCIEELEIGADRAEQYRRRNCLRLSGIPENDGESVDDKVLQVAEEVAGGITTIDIDRNHRLDRPRPADGTNTIP